MDAMERDAVVEFWSQRARSERRASDDFVGIVAALRRLGAPLPLVELAQRAVAQERLHTDLCHGLASQYAGAPIAPPAVVEYAPPTFTGADVRMDDLLHVVTTCCIQETLAGAYLRLCRDGATEQPVRAALSTMIADELDHGRIGWGLLASEVVGPADRHEISRALPAITAACVAAWGRHTAVEMQAHGVPSRAAVVAIIGEAMTRLVRPGFAHVGIE